MKSSDSSESLTGNLAVEFVDSMVNKIEDLPIKIEDLPIKLEPESTPMFTSSKRIDSHPDQEKDDE